MEVRNENIGIVVFTVTLLLGCWLANWDPGEGAAAVIVTSAFLACWATITGLYVRERRSTRR